MVTTHSVALRAFRLPLLALAALLTASCGADTAVTVPGLNISGTWHYTGANIMWPTVSESCGLFADITFTQTGPTLTGGVQSGDLSCTIGGGAHEDIRLDGEAVVNGMLQGSAVQFDIGSSDIRTSGTVANDSITGHISLRVPGDSTGKFPRLTAFVVLTRE